MSSANNEEKVVVPKELSFKERLAASLPPEPPVKKNALTIDATSPRVRQFYTPSSFNPDEFPFDTVDHR